MAKLYPIPPSHHHDEVYLKKGEGGVTDHGALTGLSDDDHPQYLLTTAKASDSDKLDNIDSTGFVQTSGNQSVGGIKTFTSIPALPATNPTTANQAVRKGFADATYLGISAKAADSDKLDGLDSTAFVGVSDPIGFWIPPAAFATDASWVDFAENRVPNLVTGTATILDTFISLPTSGKRLELTGLMTSNATGDILTGVELRHLQEAAGQPSTANVFGTWVFTISPAYAIRKKTTILDVSGYSANSTFALRVYRNGAHSADTCSGHGYFFGVSGRWID